MHRLLSGFIISSILVFPNVLFGEGNKIVISQEVLIHQRNKDIETIAALKRNKSNLLRPHLIEHHFNVYNELSAKKLSVRGVSLGYKCSPIKKDEYNKIAYWHFDLIKSAIPQIEVFTKETTLMLVLAQEFDADYDGWGTEIVK
jgi:regulator of RNase E activity RraB